MLLTFLHNAADKVTEGWWFLCVFSIVISCRDGHQIHKQKLVKLAIWLFTASWCKKKLLASYQMTGFLVGLNGLTLLIPTAQIAFCLPLVLGTKSGLYTLRLQSIVNRLCPLPVIFHSLSTLKNRNHLR